MHRFLQFAIYLSVVLDILMFIYAEKVVASPASEWYGLSHFLVRMAGISIYYYPIHSKLFTLILICLVSIGTLSRKVDRSSGHRRSCGVRRCPIRPNKSNRKCTNPLIHLLQHHIT